MPACLGCHSPRGYGNAAAGYPHISGQQKEYTTAALKGYRDGSKNYGGTWTQMMQGVAANLNDREIDALANYVHGLH